MDILALLARFLFSAIFIYSGFGHLTRTQMMAQYTAAKRVPAAKFFVIITGIMILFGGLSILLGAYVKIGALLIVIFLVPVALIMHNFWTLTDPMARGNDRAHFMKDISLAGAAFLIWYFWNNHVPLSLAP